MVLLFKKESEKLKKLRKLEHYLKNLKKQKLKRKYYKNLKENG